VITLADLRRVEAMDLEAENRALRERVAELQAEVGYTDAIRALAAEPASGEAEQMSTRMPTDAEFEAQAETLFDLAHNNFGWRPIERSLRGAFELGERYGKLRRAALAAEPASESAPEKAQGKP
jgi:hypothetical protein